MSEPTSHTSETDEVRQTIRLWRVLLPVCIGIGVVVFLLWKQYDPSELKNIQWTRVTAFWIGVAIVLLICRHIAYAWRLKVLSADVFSWRKAIQLIFIWEFSSAVSPTSLGGSAVALIVLSQEKLKTARVASIVLYTVVLDTAFFIITLPILYLFIGPEMVQPGLASLFSASGIAQTFSLAYVAMLIYGSFFAYGLFVKPETLSQFLKWLSTWPIITRWQDSIRKTADDLVLAAREMLKADWKYHVKAALATIIAWSFRFLVLSAVMLAFSDQISYDLITQINIYGRLQSMFVIIAFSPTPGGSGFVEYIFTEYLQDYAGSQALISAVFWRLLSYYLYLIAGLFIIPAWLRSVMKR